MPTTRSQRVRITCGGKSFSSRGRHCRFEHRLQFHGRPGQQHEDHAVVCDPLAGRGAAIVGQHLGALDHVSLTAIVLRHLATERAEPRFDAIANLLLENQRPAERAGDGFAREIVFGGSQAAGENDDLRTRRRAQDAVGEPLAFVADHGFAHHLHAQRVELIGEVQRVGVEPLRRQQFRTDRDDLGILDIGGIREEAGPRCRHPRDRARCWCTPPARARA